MESEIPPTAFRDRSARLVLFGSVAVLAGAGLVLLGLLQLALIFLPKLAAFESIPMDPRSAVIGVLTHGLLGVAFVFVGLGSIRKRRWVRPLMLVLAWTWLLTGALTLLLVPRLIDGMAASDPGGSSIAVPPELMGPLKLLALVLTAGAGVLLPALFVWVYNDRDLLLTCEAHDTTPAWTERCPTSVVGIVISLVAVAGLSLPLAVRATVPLFGYLATGWSGAIVLFGAAAICLWLARELYALRRRGWWGTVLLMVGVGVSTIMTVAAVGLNPIYRELGYPEESIAMLEHGGLSDPTAANWLTAAFTVLTLVYMLAIRKHFQR